jgi:hypothetical protein
MRTSSILALAVLVGFTPLAAQTSNKSEIGMKRSVSDTGGSADVAVDFIFGTFGFGLQVSKLVTPHVAIRANGSYFSLNRTITQTDIEYAADLKLGAFSGLVDFFPGSRGAFHLTGGAVANRTKADLRGNCTNGTMDINGTSYTCAQVGTLTGSVAFPSVSPYVGFGVGTPAMGSRVHFVMDIGGAFGTPTLTLVSSNSGSNAQLAADMKAQRDKTQKDVNKYLRIYPVFESGIGIRF